MAANQDLSSVESLSLLLTLLPCSIFLHAAYHPSRHLENHRCIQEKKPEERTRSAFIIIIRDSMPNMYHKPDGKYQIRHQVESTKHTARRRKCRNGDGFQSKAPEGLELRGTFDARGDTRLQAKGEECERIGKRSVRKNKKKKKSINSTWSTTLSSPTINWELSCAP